MRQRIGTNGKRILAAWTLVAGASLALCAVAGATTWNLVATIDGLQEVPPTPSPATGSGTFVLDDAANTLSYTIIVDTASLLGPETAAHIHGFAPPGVNASVKHTLPLGSPKVGVWSGFSDADEANILAGLTYVNVHTTVFPGGEIRGQIVQAPNATESSTWGQVKALYR
jgi:hypothetical protein